MRVSDLPTNREVRLPEPLETSEESKLLSFKVEVLESVKKYIQENCSESGRQEVNISQDELEGIKSLRRRIKDEDLVIMETDKSKKLSIMTKENYVLSTDPHTNDDLTITNEDLRHIEKTLNGHALQFSRACLISYNQGDFVRVKRAMVNDSINPPPLRSVRLWTSFKANW